LDLKNKNKPQKKTTMKNRFKNYELEYTGCHTGTATLDGNDHQITLVFDFDVWYDHSWGETDWGIEVSHVTVEFYNNELDKTNSFILSEKTLNKIKMDLEERIYEQANDDYCNCERDDTWGVNWEDMQYLTDEQRYL
jgi:hypothetical protein